ncbi:MAG TPA: SHOCT domain-containing protein [Blastococcus sp.]|nr:SHOCT domain-containing protein [Blastococcus sp.]
MPRLLRMAARTAVVAGTASAVSGRVQHRQANRWAGQEAQAAEPAPAAAAPEQRSAPPAEDRLQQLKQLGDLKAQGVLTEEEFATEKARILAG